MDHPDELTYERTTIQLVPDLMAKLDRMRRRLGINRSAMLAILIAQADEDKDSRDASR